MDVVSKELLQLPSPYGIAATFSAAMRWYSAGEHVPWAIIRLLRAIASHDAVINSATISDRGRLRRELRFAISAPL